MKAGKGRFAVDVFHHMPLPAVSALKPTAHSGRKSIAARSGEPWLFAFGEEVRRPPSQKELAGILQVTTRHLRRWENETAAAGCACSRPYTHADLWRLYQHRGRKGWDRDMAARLGLVSVFERFDQIRFGGEKRNPKDTPSMMAALMLRSIAIQEAEAASGAASLPRMFGAGLVEMARAQLRAIMDCEQACDLFVKAFLEAALIADAKTPGTPPDPDGPRGQVC